MTHSHFRRGHQRGFTLFELLGVVAIIGIAVFAAMKVKRGAEIRSAANTLANNINFVTQKAPEVYPTSFAGLTCAVLANNGAFTGTSFRVDRSVPATPVVFYSNEPTSTLTCAPANLFGTNDAYTLTLPGLQNDMCNEVVDKLNASAWRIVINGTEVKPPRGVVDPAAKGAACNAAGTIDQQSVVVTLSRSQPAQ